MGFKEYLAQKAVVLTVGIPKNSFGSIDITNRCQLRCKHCYFFEQENPKEMSKEDWIARFEEMSKGPLRTWSITWIGGEPLLRKDIIDIGRKYFSHNMVVTNGLAPLPDWKDVSFHVSIDGNEEQHENQRNQKNIYKRIMRNVNRPDLEVVVAYCISSLNIHCVEEVLEEWRNVGIRGFLFSFYTPIESIQDPLFPGWEERDRIIDRLIELKKTKYGSYIQNEVEILEMMKSDRSKEVTDSCVFATKGISLDPIGEKKPKCMMGEKADCDKCGCIVPFYLHWRTNKKRVVKEMFQDLSSYMSSRARHLFHAAHS
jgi:Fe-coproporphyrin III synthase